MTRSSRFATVLALIASASTADGQQTATVRGIVRDSATKQPLLGAIVQITDGVRQHAVRTDEAGEFQIPKVELGSYRAVIRRIGYTSSSRQISVDEGMRPLSLDLPPIPRSLRAMHVHGEGTGVFGQIARAEDLTPIAGATVFIAGSRDSVVTDSTGAYFMPLKGPGLFMVRANAPGFIEDLFVIEVKRNAVADGSRLLDAGVGPKMHPIFWKDFDQRQSWRTVNTSALLSGSEIRRVGNSVTAVLAQSGTMVSSAMRLGPGVCVFVDGQPRPGIPLDAYRPEDIKAIEVYAERSDAAMLALQDWPKNQKCSGTGEPAVRVRGAKPIAVVVIWRR